MNNYLFDYNSRNFHYIHQKLELSFPFETMDIEAKMKKKDSTFEKQSIPKKIYKNNDLYRTKIESGYNSINIDCVNKNCCNANLIATNGNNSYPKKEDVINPINKGNSEVKLNEKKIFNIKKVNKKIGRIKKSSNLKGTHNKSSEDNIIRKIKGRFIENLRKYINNEYKKYILKRSKTNKKISCWLKRINPKIYRKIKKEENLKWFETKIYNIFSENISSRYVSYSGDINKKRINRLIYLNEAKNIIDILNINIETFFEKYINNETIEGFKTIKDDLIELKSSMEKSKQENIEAYLIKYEYIAKNMKTIFKRKNSRNKK